MQGAISNTIEVQQAVGASQMGDQINDNRAQAHCSPAATAQHNTGPRLLDSVTVATALQQP